MSNPTEAFGVRLGDRLRLVSMGPDPCPMEPGATGTVTHLCDSYGITQIGVMWDPHVGRSLNLCPESDRWEIIGHDDDWQRHMTETTRNLRNLLRNHQQKETN